MAGQMQEPEDDVTGVAAFGLAALVVSLLLDEAGLVCGAALCGKKKKIYIYSKELLLRTQWSLVVIRFCDLGA